MRRARKRVRKVEENKEAEAPGESLAATMRERKVACGDVNVLHTTDDQNKMNAPTVAVPFIVRRVADDQRSRRRRRVRARMRREKVKGKKEEETKAVRMEEKQVGEVKEHGDKEAGRETAKEVREEKIMERATKSRTQ